MRGALAGGTFDAVRTVRIKVGKTVQAKASVLQGAGKALQAKAADLGRASKLRLASRAVQLALAGASALTGAAVLVEDGRGVAGAPPGTPYDSTYDPTPHRSPKITPDGPSTAPVLVATAGGAVPNPPPPHPSSPPSTSSFYVTQNRTRWNPYGLIDANCGPMSLEMDAIANGVLRLDPNRSNAEALGEYTRRMMTGADNIYASTSVNDVIRGASRMGLHAYEVSTIVEIDDALRQGRMVVAMGNPGAYGKPPGWHFILIVGRTSSGGYVINDPAYEGRPGVVISAGQMARFFASGAAVYR